jgi:hypothetical protein
MTAPAAAQRPAWRLTVYDADLEGGSLALPAPGWRFVYVRDGDIVIESDGSRLRAAADEGHFAPGEAGLTGAGRAWIFELAPADAGRLTGATLRLSHLVRPAFDGPCLMRADRIQSPAGAQTPRHGHRGPGIRRLLFGCLMAEVGEAMERIEAGDAWFETGQDPVVGTNIGGGDAAFVRVMVLPGELEGGKTSFMASDAVEAAKPRAVTQHIFGEIKLPEIHA